MLFAFLEKWRRIRARQRLSKFFKNFFKTFTFLSGCTRERSTVTL